MTWGNLRFYVRCPKTDKKIYILSVPQNPYEAKYEFSEFSIDCPHCGEEHTYSAYNIHAEPESKRNWLFGMLFGWFISLFLSPVLFQVVGYFTIVICITIMAIGYLMGKAYDVELERRSMKYESVLMEVSEG